MTPAPPPTAPPGRGPGPPHRATAGAARVTALTSRVRARSTTRVNARAAARTAACATAVALLLPACGPGGDGPHHSAKSAAGATGATAPAASAPVPRGKGSRLPDDLNGDGYPDLQLPAHRQGGPAQPDRLRPRLVPRPRSHHPYRAGPQGPRSALERVPSRAQPR